MLEINKIYQGDCLEVMEKIDTASIDMILCDLPYGVTNNQKDKVIPFEKLWKQYERIIKENGVIALFAQGIFYVDLVSSNRKLFRYDLVWDKKITSGFLNCNRQPLRKHEQIAIFYKKQPTYNPQFSIGEPSHSKGKCLNNHRNINYGKYNEVDNTSKNKYNKFPSSIVEYQKPHPSIAVHPTQKSVELCKYLIKTYTNENELVLDNCIGSGTTAIACIETNRDYIGIELQQEYVDIANKRISELKRV